MTCLMEGSNRDLQYLVGTHPLQRSPSDLAEAETRCMATQVAFRWSSLSCPPAKPTCARRRMLYRNLVSMDVEESLRAQSHRRCRSALWL